MCKSINSQMPGRRRYVTSVDGETFIGFSTTKPDEQTAPSCVGPTTADRRRIGLTVDVNTSPARTCCVARLGASVVANSVAPTVPVVLGGEHSVSLGTLRALKARYGHFGIIHFDAHADLRDTYQGSPYSHACVMRRAVSDLGLALFQIGVRSLSPEEQKFRTTAGIRHWDASRLQCPRPWAGHVPASGALGTPSNQGAEGLSLPVDFPERVFLSFDIDALDSSLMPATGTPEPGGLFWWDALNLARISLQGKVLLGFDMVELAPLAGLHAPSYTAARLTHELMGLTRQS